MLRANSAQFFTLFRQPGTYRAINDEACYSLQASCRSQGLEEEEEEEEEGGGGGGGRSESLLPCFMNLNATPNTPRGSPLLSCQNLANQHETGNEFQC